MLGIQFKASPFELLKIDINSMTYQPHELANLFFVEKYFNQLSGDDISRRFFNGEKYQSTFATRLTLFFSAHSVISELQRFYPYEPMVKRTAERYEETSEETRTAALVVTGTGLFALHQFAKQNVVLPIFSKFGKAFKTHRLFRQYIWMATLPYLLASAYTNYLWMNQIQHLWAVHAERLNQKILSDPQTSQYPKELLPLSQVNSWFTPTIQRFDLPKKWNNEKDIFLAEDYTEIEEWNKQELADADAEESAEGEQGASSEEAGESAPAEAEPEAEE